LLPNPPKGGLIAIFNCNPNKWLKISPPLGGPREAGGGFTPKTEAGLEDFARHRLMPDARCQMPRLPSNNIEFILYYCGDFEKYHIFATNFSHKIMSNLLIISSFKLKL